jgi:LmbE family N-acetylglucosaminyl deacetylase
MNPRRAFGIFSQSLRVTVLSPHLDDGVLSLGASIADAVRTGSEVTIISVFAGDPEAPEPAGAWDRRAGFATHGEAARVRREEDVHACAALGARPAWLALADEQYVPDPDEAVLSHLAEAVSGMDVVLVPGRPLVHADHQRLYRLVSSHGLDHAHLRLYAELPYDLWRKDERQSDMSPRPSEAAEAWPAVRVSARARLAKWSACGAYSSQLRWLGRGYAYRRALLRTRLGAERIHIRGNVSPPPTPVNRDDTGGRAER